MHPNVSTVKFLSTYLKTFMNQLPCLPFEAAMQIHVISKELSRQLFSMGRHRRRQSNRTRRGGRYAD